MNTKQNGNNHHPLNLKYFTQPDTLRQIGTIRIPMFLDGFKTELAAGPLAAFSNLNPEPSSDFTSLAALFANPAVIPERLRATLLTLESAASPEKNQRLDEVLQRRLP